MLAHHQMCQADLSPLCFLVCLSMLAVAALPAKGEHPQLADLVRSQSGQRPIGHLLLLLLYMTSPRVASYLQIHAG